MANKLVAFFATDNGKSVAALFGLIGVGTGMCVKCLPNVLLDQTKEFLQLFKYHSYIFSYYIHKLTKLLFCVHLEMDFPFLFQQALLKNWNK